MCLYFFLMCLATAALNPARHAICFLRLRSTGSFRSGLTPATRSLTQTTRPPITPLWIIILTLYPFSFAGPPLYLFLSNVSPRAMCVNRARCVMPRCLRFTFFKYTQRPQPMHRPVERRCCE